MKPKSKTHRRQCAPHGMIACRASFAFLVGLVTVSFFQPCAKAFENETAADRHAVHRYFPLHDGDSKFYSGPEASLTFSVSTAYFQGQPVFSFLNSYDGSTVAYTYSDTQLVMHGTSVDWIDLVLDPPLVELDENLILNGGTRTSKLKAMELGMTVNLTFTVTVEQSGTLTVAAGTFQNCREVTETIVVSVPGSSSQKSSQTFVLAPGVGQIRIFKIDDRSAWIDLISGTVDGVNVSELAAQSALSSPRFTAHPKNQSVPYGGTAIFQVTADGSGPLSFQWSKDGTNLTDSPSCIGVGTPKLTIVASGMEAQGAYSVCVTNQAGCAVSQDAFLTVTPDLSRPTLTITNPAPKARVYDAVANVRGKANDNTGVVMVRCQLNGGPWTIASGTSVWQATVELTPGTNIFRAYAMDSAGNCSATNVLALVYVVTCPINLSVNGRGSIGPLTNGQVLELGKRYTIKATPRPGNVFSNWTGTISSFTPAFSFTMSSNLALVANFVTNPFIVLKGSYTALFYETNLPSHENSGLLSLQLTEKGAYSGRLQQGAIRYSFSGQFDLGLSAQKRIARPGAGELFLSLRLPPDADQLTGTVTNGVWASELFGYRTTFSRSHPATNFKGAYTMLLPGAGSSNEGPAGNGCGCVTVNIGGNLSFKGTLSDGNSVIQTASVAANGQWPFYLPLYGGKGSIFGWLTLQNTITNDIAGLVLWTQPQGVAGAICPSGFTNGVEVLGSSFVPPPAGSPLLDCTNAVLVLEGGNLESAITADVRFDSKNRIVITSQNTNKLALTFLASTGIFRGSFAHPQTARQTKLTGVVLSKQNYGAGFFLGTGQSGSVFLGEPE